jgi:hypothetical protein
MRNAYKVLWRSLSDRGRLETQDVNGVGVGGRNNIRMDLTEMGWECVDWMYLAVSGCIKLTGV